MHYGEGLGRVFVHQICAKFGCFNGVKEMQKTYVYVHICDGVFKVRYFPKSCVNIEPKFGKKTCIIWEGLGRAFVCQICAKFGCFNGVRRGANCNSYISKNAIFVKGKCNVCGVEK